MRALNESAGVRINEMRKKNDNEFRCVECVIKY